MNLRRAFVISAFAIGLASAQGDQANPGLEAFLRQNHYGQVMTSLDENNNQYFDAQINGKTVHFMIDTGCDRTLLSHDSARHLRLVVRETSDTENGVGGSIPGHMGAAFINSFTINHWEINHLNPIAVLPSGANWDNPYAGGLFGLDSLSLNSALLVVGGKGFLIKPGPGKGASFAAYMQGMGFIAVPLQVSKNRLLVPGSIDGFPLTALIDTGSAITGCQETFLEKNQISTDSTRVVMEPLDGETTLQRRFRTEKMSLGSCSFGPSIIFSIPGRTLEKDHVDALIGYDFLAAHAALIDAGNGVLWLNPK
jgi:hypothetical protein